MSTEDFRGEMAQKPRNRSLAGITGWNHAKKDKNIRIELYFDEKCNGLFEKMIEPYAMEGDIISLKNSNPFSLL